MPHVEDRINRFLDSEQKNYQAERAIDAFVNGSFLGKGPGNGVVKKFIPDVHTDFIFSAIASFSDSTLVNGTEYSQVAEVPEKAAEPLPEQPEGAEAETRYEGKLYNLANVELAPEFQGGQTALGKYLGSRLRYPASARQNKIQGKVYIGFIVEKNGSLVDFRVVKGIGGGCDEEAIRVLRSSPSWRPGMASGKPVRTSYVLPITFQLGN